ncbi:hypothetical protein CHLNCDRAFT_36764 [Chlorella variabilis]|uniref:Cystinosin n=1 Tax=Chlorella variabilis TaxID=554065 RepID=E1ZNG4_CHLVA|nr:hypothetical protein CHLNCDRAFT_36764 [Chlorella variabilis]EFN52603.1 hypothetical protein CHLNCDRAFT_36764 [Chlorella variabilis]|eukprot:XP_005844705.1 hypothetical protein CHLNCDRAFT_36764 [Chlorella variabilis]
MSSTPLLGAADAAAAADVEVAVEAEGDAGFARFEARCTVCIEEYAPCCSMRRQAWEGGFWLGTPVVLGVLLGALLPTSQQCPVMPEPLDRVSSIIGWVYFCAWSISFYPQAYLNYRRKSVVGLSLDFQLLNLLGFGCYAVYNTALFWNPGVRKEYACLHGGSLPAVHANDVFFALHASVVTALTLIQCALYHRGGQRISWPAALGTGVAGAAITAYLAAVIGAATQGGGGGIAGGAFAVADAPAVPCGSTLSWLSFLYFLSYIKLAVSLVKYIPQVWLNYRRQSTVGWNIHNVLLDFGGGLLSLVQLLMDGALTHDWTAVTGNPVKFGLGFASMLFDLIFMAQHWLLYPAVPACSLWEAAAAAAALDKAACKAGAAVPAGDEAAPVAGLAQASGGLADWQPLLLPEA